MSRIVKIILGINLVALAVLAFAYPHLMIAPGKLIPGHDQLNADCFACHTVFIGAASERCTECHEPVKIGRLTTAGKPVLKPLTSTPFHQKLISDDCVSCHSDHAGVKRFRQQGHFDHALLQTAARELCQECHKSPDDSLHREISGTCGHCHSDDKWTPATFDHGEYFALDRDHDVRCATCHQGNDYGRYTCYGCHEHTRAGIRRKHIEEGIRDFDNCVECHRSADEHDIRGPYGERRKDGRDGQRHEDDD